MQTSKLQSGQETIFQTQIATTAPVANTALDLAAATPPAPETPPEARLPLPAAAAAAATPTAASPPPAKPPSERGGRQAAGAWAMGDQPDRERDLKAKHEELEDIRQKLQVENDTKQRLERQVAGLNAEMQEVQARLQRAQDSNDKLRADNKRKAEQVEKMERAMSQMEDRIRNLEIRASEVDKAELTLETTRRSLESSQQECRAKEGEISRLQDKHAKTCQELKHAMSSIEELEKKLEDLKHQVRHELMKNEKIERGLETIPRLKDDIEERQRRVTELEKEVEEKSALLTATRRTLREYKDRIRELQQGQEGMVGVQEDAEVARQEVVSLKQLMAAKDALLFRKAQALQRAKVALEALAGSQEEAERVHTLQHLLMSLASPQHHPALAANGTQSYEMNGSKRATPQPTSGLRQENEAWREPHVAAPHGEQGDGDCGLLERCLQEPRDSPTPTPSSRPQMAVVLPVRRAASFSETTPRQHLHQQPVAPRTPSSFHPSSRPLTSSTYRPDPKLTPSLHYPLGQDRNVTSGKGRHLMSKGEGHKTRPYSAMGTGWPRAREDDVESGGEGKEGPLKLGTGEREELLAIALAPGDRVSVILQQRPPRYGRKKPKAVMYTGIVKYLGPLDTELCDARLYCGVRLDEPIGENDGVYKGKRYMFTPHNHAKFFRLRDITSVLDVKTGQYITTNRLLLKHVGKLHSVPHPHLLATF